MKEKKERLQGDEMATSKNDCPITLKNELCTPDTIIRTAIYVTSALRSPKEPFDDKLDLNRQMYYRDGLVELVAPEHSDSVTVFSYEGGARRIVFNGRISRTALPNGPTRWEWTILQHGNWVPHLLTLGHRARLMRRASRTADAPVS